MWDLDLLRSVGLFGRTDSAWYEVLCNGTFTMYYFFIFIFLFLFFLMALEH